MKNWSLNTKISLVLGIFVAAAIVIAGMGLKKMSDINALLDEATSTVATRLSIARAIQYRVADMAGDMARVALADSKERLATLEKSINDNHERLTARFDQFHELAPQERKGKIAEMKKNYIAYYEAVIKTARFIEEGKLNEAKANMATVRPLRMGLEESTEELVVFNDGELKRITTQAHTDFATARNMMVATSIIAILMGLSLAFFIMRAVNSAINTVISNLDENSNQVTSAAQQIAASSEQLSQAATEQAASLEQTAASIEEMNSMVQKNSENASKSASVSSSSQESATRGKQVVQDMIGAIEAINASNNDIMLQINESNAQISDIVKVIAEIGNKTKVINDIVFQTKLLSFNASVEAARAGEHGKGFAVVAEEVGNLAQMSGNAAKEISSMLEGSIQKVEGIVNETKSKVERLITQGKEKVETGTRVAQQCGEVLDEIVGNVGSVSQMVNEIASACQEQSQGVQEITKAMGQLDQVTQENASTSEEAASSAEELSAQADALRGVVQTLIVTIKGARASQNFETVAPREVARPTRPAVTKAPANVVPMKSAVKAAAPKTAAAELKKAAGYKNGVPAENDPRFEEV